MSLETPTDTNSSFTSEELNEQLFYHIEDEPLRSPTPPPILDAIEYEFDDLLASRMPPLMLTPPPEDPTRPETSTSSIFSFDVEPVRTPPPSERLRLPTFIVPENQGFFDSVSASDTNLYISFGKWYDDCTPLGDSFAVVSAEEQAKHPRETRSEPELPSLFKKREHGCGYCRSISYPRWENHTKQKCEQLKALAPCKICGAKGEMNHTETYCPAKPSVLLPLTQRYLESSEAGRYQRNREHFHKYSSWIRRIYSSSD
ncbi:hypothetical protein GCK72_006413 [Caenorhabditis remanei]|uniref:Nanos-type domain-containing protein n=1 Tax=Caenorhabditis remanei TaxID=31234 RepID=A0A6A5HIE8_CAERE|nr:hypothetical protein GCK72_006413 [Caenorhabditis remanei]KAF1766456.1 hypothetical protein GCK72_006413 [Caenorhabditis remanei]